MTPIRDFLLLTVVSLVAGCGTRRVAVEPGGSPGNASVQSAPREPITVAAPAPMPVEFSAQIRPLLESRCSPCHFEGGKMYATLPFDWPETIRTLGEKLFTRIKDEQGRALIRAFLAEPQS